MWRHLQHPAVAAVQCHGQREGQRVVARVWWTIACGWRQGCRGHSGNRHTTRPRSAFYFILKNLEKKKFGTVVYVSLLSERLLSFFKFWNVTVTQLDQGEFLSQFIVVFIIFSTDFETSCRLDTSIFKTIIRISNNKIKCDDASRVIDVRDAGATQATVTQLDQGQLELEIRMKVNVNCNNLEEKKTPVSIFFLQILAVTGRQNPGHRYATRPRSAAKI